MNAINDLDLNAAALFTKVVEKGSFTAAAAALGLRVSTVSRRVARFEAQVGSRLLHRTTRKLSLTDAGRTFHGTLVSGLEQIEVAAATLENLQRLISRLVSLPKQWCMRLRASRDRQTLTR